MIGLVSLLAFGFICSVSGIIDPAVQPIRTHCNTYPDDDDFCGDLYKDREAMEEYSSTLSPTDTDRAARDLTANVLDGVTTAHFLPESVAQDACSSGDPISDQTIDLTNQLEELAVYLNNLPKSCKDILDQNVAATSGYYIISANGTMENVYCDMVGIHCGESGGWTRIAFLDMTDPEAVCPSAIQIHQYPNLNHPLCGRPKPSEPGCESIYYSSHGVSYSSVCGQMKAYQFNSNDAFTPNVGGLADIDHQYVDGYSITYGYPRNHIWTYAGGLEQKLQFGNYGLQCPCNQGQTISPPAFVGNDYYCESGLPVGQSWSSVLYDDPLWDGQNCIEDEVSCCTNANMPWFYKTLGVTITDHIEVRLCQSQHTNDEDTPLELIELYVR